MYWKSKLKYRLLNTASNRNYQFHLLELLFPEIDFKQINAFSFTHTYANELNKEEALEIFECVKRHMNLDHAEIQLDFF